MSFAEIVQQFAPAPSNALEASFQLHKETLGFLQGCGLIEITPARSWSERCFHPLEPTEQGFELTLLGALSRQSDPRQQALRKVHDTLVGKGAMQYGLGEIVEILETSAPIAGVTWNATKVGFWATLYQALGLLIRHNPDQVVLSPQSTLLRQLVPTTKVSLQGWLEAIERSHFACFSREGHLHGGLVVSLLRLERQGVIGLSYQSDAPGSVMVDGRRISHIHREVL